MTTEFVLDALNQAICQRVPSQTGLVHHSDRGSQYLSIKYTERLAEEGIDPSVGSVGDSYDNALAESVIGSFKAEVIDFFGPWKSMTQVEWQTLKWVAWYNADRLHSAIDYKTPNEAEDIFSADLSADEEAASILSLKLSGKPRGGSAVTRLWAISRPSIMKGAPSKR